jgi:hypothetical protein
VAMHNSDRTHNALQDARVGAGVNPKNVLSLVEKPRKCSQWSWCCDNCGTQGGMSAFIEQCPECRHIRCGSCQMERLSPKDVYYKSQKTSLKRGALLSKGTSAPRLPWPEAQAGNSFQATSAPTLVE